MTLLPFLSLFLISQTATDYSVYPGASTEFQEAIVAVETLTSSGDWTGASKAMGLLPKRKFVVGWSEANLPEPRRIALRRARDEAIQAWKTALPSVDISLSTKSKDISISFEKVLAKSPRADIPLGLTEFWGDSASPSRLEAVIGLARGNPTEDTTPVQVYNEVLYAIGSYLGLSESTIFGSAMGRSDQPGNFRCTIISRERMNAIANFELVESLAAAIAKKEKVAPTSPGLYTEVRTADAGSAVQGDTVSVTFQVGNRGSGVLRLQVKGDCSCITAKSPDRLGPSETGSVTATYRTDDIYGDIRHNVVMYTNDPDNPMIMIPVSLKVEPRYRFLSTVGDVVVMDDLPKSLTLFLIPRKGDTWVPSKVLMTGIPGKATIAPWSGALADPEMKEPEKLRQGYKITINPTKGAVPNGRLAVNVTVLTTDPDSPRLSHTFFVQKGIISLPESVFFIRGTGSGSAGSVLVSRPGKPFKVTSVKSTSPAVRAVLKAGKRNDEYQIDLKYDGKAPQGFLDSEVVVYTDDKSQPEVRIRVGAGN